MKPKRLLVLHFLIDVPTGKKHVMYSPHLDSKMQCSIVSAIKLKSNRSAFASPQCHRQYIAA